jgi:hypothetical protein
VRRTRGFLLAVVALVALVVPASASSLPPQPGGVYPPPFVFAIWHESTRASEIYTLEPRTGRRTVVVRSGSGALYPAAWRASTGRVYYVQDYSTSGEVMSVPVTGGTPRSEQVVLDRNSEFDVSPDGGTYLWTRMSDHGTFETVSRPAGGASSDVRVIADDGRFARFSPDGKRILFSRTINKVGNTDSGDIAVYLMNADGSDIRRVTQFPPHDNTSGVVVATNGRMSFSGGRVLYTYSTPSRAAWPNDLYAVEPSGVNKRLVSRNAYNADWSSNNWLLYTKQDANNGNLYHAAVRSPGVPGREYVLTGAGYLAGLHFRS